MVVVVVEAVEGEETMEAEVTVIEVQVELVTQEPMER